MSCYHCHQIRCTGITTPGISATLKYDDIGRMESYTATDIASKATLTIKLTFDDFSREIRRDITDQKGQSVCSIAQTYYPNGQVKNRTTTRGDESLRDEKYTYNNRNQLIDYICSGTEKSLDAYGKAITHQAFTYGVLGNITSLVAEFEEGKDTASYTYAANDPTQLYSVTHIHKDYPALQTPTYDNAGQLTDDGVGHTLSYDALGRVNNIQGTKSQGCTYRYDASNTQVGQDTSGGSQHDFYYAQVPGYRSSFQN